MAINKLKGKITESNTTIQELADIIGISKSTLYRHICDGGEQITIKEATVMADKLGLSQEEAVDIFFNDEVPQMGQ